MTIRRITTALATAALAAAALVLPGAPAQAASDTYDADMCVAAANPIEVDRTQLALIAETSTPLPGVTGHIRQVSYTLPDGYRCDVAWIHVPAAAAGQSVKATIRVRGQVLVTDGQGYEYLRTDAEYIDNGVTIPKSDYTSGSYRLRAGIRVLGTIVYKKVNTYVSQPGTSAEKTYTETGQPMKWELTLSAESGSKTVTTPATPEAVATATAARDAAVSASLKTKVKAIKKARKRYLKAKAAAETSKELRDARKAYTLARKKASRQHEARVVKIEATYQTAIAPVVTTTTFVAATTGPLTGQVPPDAGA